MTVISRGFTDGVLESQTEEVGPAALCPSKPWKVLEQGPGPSGVTFCGAGGILTFAAPPGFPRPLQLTASGLTVMEGKEVPGCPSPRQK